MASTKTEAAGDGHETAVGGDAGTVAEGGVEHVESVFPPFDSTTFPSQLLWLAITFGTLYYLMAKVALPRIAGILENRRDRIASDLDTAGRLKEESDEAIAGYERALGEARQKAFTIAESARQEARDAADKQRAGIEEELNTKLAAAETRIGEIKSQALREVSSIATEAAGEIVAKLSDTGAPPADVVAAVAAAMKEESGHAE
jgi:F-type H+-transporting ATPase subunit b